MLLSRHFPRPVYIATTILVLGVVLTSINIFQLRSLHDAHLREFVQMREYVTQSLSRQEASGIEDNNNKRIALITGRPTVTTYLSHLIDVLKKYGYSIYIDDLPDYLEFDLLWSHEYPFSDLKLSKMLTNLRSYQKVNHIAGSGFYTSKVSLATANIPEGVPRAFELPNEKEAFLRFAESNPEKLWVKKSNEHRGIKIFGLSELDLNDNGSFVQEYISKPFLIDKRKFDIGIYTVVTSVSPLRVYVYEGDVLLRFCSEDYQPFDARNIDKYVVGDDYTPVWQMPSLKKYYIEQKMTFRETLNAYLRANGRDPTVIWENLKEAIATVFETQQKKLILASTQFRDKRPFFELSRFDFVLDSDLNVFLMEANMSPNLSSGHFAANKLLYEQVINNLLSLVGVASHFHGQTTQANFGDKNLQELEVSERDLRVYANECTDLNATCHGPRGCDSKLICKLCGHCMQYHLRTVLRDAYKEHIRRQNMRRVLPRSSHRPEHVNKMHTESDRLMILWYYGKCKQDAAWCT